MDINSDLGEGEPESLTRTLMSVIDVANIACGGHAGDNETMHAAVDLARQENVVISAHPGHVDPDHFGRRQLPIDSHALASLLRSQIGSLKTIAGRAGAAVLRVKLHGALYHQVESNEDLAKAYLVTVQDLDSRLSVVCFPGGAVETIAKELNMPIIREGFADRRYRENGQLLPRTDPHSLVHDSHEVRAQVMAICQQKPLPYLAHRTITAETLCIHADSPDAVTIARTAKAVIDEQKTKPTSN